MRVADLELRDATVDDAVVVADIDTEAHPDDPQDPKLMRHWWSMPTDEVTERRIALLDGAPVGYWMFRHPPWSKEPDRYARLNAELRPSARTAGRLDALVASLEDRAWKDETRKVTIWSWVWDTARISVLTGRGYREERRQRYWQLDLLNERERITTMAAESRARMKREGILVLTLAEDRDPKHWEKLKRMSDEAESDVPSTVPFVPMERLDDWITWFDSPGIRLDRSWIARESDDIVGISQLAYPPVRGVVSTDWTATARNVRGRGVARALKCETLMQAIARGVDCVRTDNDSTNAPILHINETMGYRRRPDMVQYLKELS